MLLQQLCIFLRPKTYFGKIINWDLIINIPLHYILLRDHKFQAAYLITAAITFASTLVLIRGLDVGNGILSLLELSSEIAIGEAMNRDSERMQPAQEALGQMEPREGFGDFVDLKH